MGNNLIHNYLNNSQNTAQTPKQPQRSGKSYFQIPTVSSTMDSFDKETDKLIKPLDGKGHLVNGSLINMPKEFVRDTVYTTKAFADGVRGKANDHQLGKMNDLGLKIGGLAIASYLMTKKTTPKTKAMEFIGFGAFLASMALWPKIALEIPARLVHGFNFRKQYIDDQGRKKYVSQDPNYIPFDLYKGDKKSEDLDVIGDRLGISKDIPNRHEAIKEQMRKISVQNNTLWMLTAGVATPIMTALACNQAEKFITPLAEKYSNRKVNNSIDEVSDYLNGRLQKDEISSYETNVLKISAPEGKKVKPDALTTMVESLKGKTITTENVASLADTLAEGFDAEMKDAAREDITNAIGGKKYIANSASTERLASSISTAIGAKDASLAGKVTPDKIKKAASEGIIRGAVKDLLTSVGIDIIDKASDGANNQVSTNFKCKEVDTLEFFRETPETKDMSPVDRLAHNIKSMIMKVNNSNPSEDFIPGMSSLEQRDKNLKSAIDARLQSGAEDIAKRFYEGEVAIGGGRENYVRTAISAVYKAEAPRGPKYKKLFADISDIIAGETSSHQGYVLDEAAAQKIQQAGAHMRRFRAVDEVLDSSAHFKVEKASETVVANNWERVNNVLIKQLGITDKEIATVSKNKALTNELFVKKLEAACSNEESYKKLITALAEAMVDLDEKLDAPNKAGSDERMMTKLESGITRNCMNAGDALGSLEMTAMKRKMVGSKHSKSGGVHQGSVLNMKVDRLHSRVDGVHSSYMRLLQTCEFFHRAHNYEAQSAVMEQQIKEQMALRDAAQQAIKENKDVQANSEIVRKANEALTGLNSTKCDTYINKYGFTENHATNKEIIARGKNLLLDAHTDKFYNKMGTLNNGDFFRTLMWSVYRPNHGTEWNQGWSTSAEDTVKILDDVKVKASDNSAQAPRRVFEGAARKSLGQKLKEHMNMMYNSFGSIERTIIQGKKDPCAIKDAGVGFGDARASKRFDLLGKAPSELLHDTLKQKANTNKWMKMFAPVLAATFAVTVGAQFFFGKKDSDIKA